MTSVITTWVAAIIAVTGWLMTINRTRVAPDDADLFLAVQTLRSTPNPSSADLSTVIDRKHRVENAASLPAMIAVAVSVIAVAVARPSTTHTVDTWLISGALLLMSLVVLAVCRMVAARTLHRRVVRYLPHG
ncbi:hypothetical protein GCM10027169_28720 [Gordonia jinhuaensis]|uniref:Uncharacterized protein n=1 Tax=Gordonia jinhuaensis TaxID=1517702 RepID=A0A916T9B5_9ACTN|nr:hypothetical protein [Gordonia jinhuaensis]GGB36631.1 hypothetical protein GCM10011489_25680 [Gordonia jinhuaensis]